MPDYEPALACWRCGALEETGAPLSGCTETRGGREDHDYVELASRPWRDAPYAEVRYLASYLGTKSTGSVATAEAFAERAAGSDASRYATELYLEKAEKRVRLLSWVLEELLARLKEAQHVWKQAEIDARIRRIEEARARNDRARPGRDGAGAAQRLDHAAPGGVDDPHPARA